MDNQMPLVFENATRKKGWGGMQVNALLFLMMGAIVLVVGIVSLALSLFLAVVGTSSSSPISPQSIALPLTIFLLALGSGYARCIRRIVINGDGMVVERILYTSKYPWMRIREVAIKDSGLVDSLLEMGIQRSYSPDKSHNARRLVLLDMRGKEIASLHGHFDMEAVRAAIEQRLAAGMASAST